MRFLSWGGLFFILGAEYGFCLWEVVGRNQKLARAAARLMAERKRLKKKREGYHAIPFPENT